MGVGCCRLCRRRAVVRWLFLSVRPLSLLLCPPQCPLLRTPSSFAPIPFPAIPQPYPIARAARSARRLAVTNAHRPANSPSSPHSSASSPTTADHAAALCRYTPSGASSGTSPLLCYANGSLNSRAGVFALSLATWHGMRIVRCVYKQTRADGRSSSSLPSSRPRSTLPSCSATRSSRK